MIVALYLSINMRGVHSKSFRPDDIGMLYVYFCECTTIQKIVKILIT
jgi:hypothetical protein